MITWIGSVGLAALVSFVIGFMWYGFLFGTAYAALRPGYSGAIADTTSAAVIVLEFARCLIVATALAYLVHRLGIVTLRDAVVLAVVVWAGFQLAGLVGSVLHEGYPVKLYAIHMGDALAKVTASCLIITGLTSRYA
jgi:hypothetical protein